MYKNFLLLTAFVLGLLCAPPSTMAQVSADYWDGGAIRIGPSTTPCDSGAEGAIRYNAASYKMEFCDGSGWTLFASSNGGQAPGGALGDGYFVLAAGIWNGDLGGITGADAKCLTDLTNNDWMGKTTAITNGQLTASKVKAFLCPSATCNNTLPLARYFFAVSGTPAAGGSYFDTNANGEGPNNSFAWNASNYFNGSFTYWTGARNSSGLNWATTAVGDNNFTCSQWTASSTLNGKSGHTDLTTSGRWQNAQGSCSSMHKLICLVNP